MLKERIAEEVCRIKDETDGKVTPFYRTLSKNRIQLIRDDPQTLQINVGLICNQTCRHCHLDAGPGRKENMNRRTVDDVVGYASRNQFQVIDITGGAPELNPNIEDIISRLSSKTPRLMFRSNLSVLSDGKYDDLKLLLKEKKVVIVASFPTLNSNQTDSQRGDGIFELSVKGLQKLNDIGYGDNRSGLELNLVSNPAGSFLPPDQVQMEKRFRQVLKKKWGISFNKLFNFANVPLGRFKKWLEQSNNLEPYMEKLASSFNPCAIQNVMCRSLVSVSWDGYFYDCDFNLACGLYMGGRKVHVSEMEGPPKTGDPIITGDHCYTCTAGAGFT